MNEEINPIRLFGLYDTPTKNKTAGGVFDTQQISPTLTCCLGRWSILVANNDTERKIKDYIRKKQS